MNTLVHPVLKELGPCNCGGDLSLTKEIYESVGLWTLRCQVCGSMAQGRTIGSVKSNWWLKFPRTSVCTFEGGKYTDPEKIELEFNSLFSHLSDGLFRMAKEGPYSFSYFTSRCLERIEEGFRLFEGLSSTSV